MSQATPRNTSELSEEVLNNFETPMYAMEMETWKRFIIGPKSSPYEDRKYKIGLTIPLEYPEAPPTVQFIDRIWHPNVEGETGEISMDILRDKWDRNFTIRRVVQCIQMLLEKPQDDYVLNEEACELYKESRDKFKEKALEFEKSMVIGRVTSESDHSAVEIARIDSATPEDQRNSDPDVTVSSLDGNSPLENSGNMEIQTTNSQSCDLDSQTTGNSSQRKAPPALYFVVGLIFSTIMYLLYRL
eukprot:GHVP01027231.1.p1 GENE.GHVP01027231.1~~GHVP01027231.1.p1  ORF type:complete len:244 (+),score=51.78 GHVP01027231.1:872-1603(+)